MKGTAGDTPDNPIEVNAVKTHSAGARPKLVKKSPAKPQLTGGQKSLHYKQRDKTCLFCGRKHTMVKSPCPAYGKKCHNCRQQNHFTPCCPKLKQAAVNAVSRERSGQNDTGQLQGAALGDDHNYIPRE